MSDNLNNTVIRPESDSSTRSNAITEIENLVLAVRIQSNVDELANALDAADWLLSRAKGIKELVEQIAIKWIDRNGPFKVGDIEHYVGYATSTRCVDVPKTTYSLLDSVGGDIDSLIQLFAAQPYKHGSVKSVLTDETYRKLFETNRTCSVKTGKPTRMLKRADSRFLPGNRNLDPNGSAR